MTILVVYLAISVTIRRRLRAPLSRFCPYCGYDLRGSLGSERCPECGERSPYYRQPPRRWSLARLRLMLSDIASVNRRE